MSRLEKSKCAMRKYICFSFRNVIYGFLLSKVSLKERVPYTSPVTKDEADLWLFKGFYKYL